MEMEWHIMAHLGFALGLWIAFLVRPCQHLGIAVFGYMYAIISGKKIDIVRSSSQYAHILALFVFVIYIFLFSFRCV